MAHQTDVIQEDADDLLTPRPCCLKGSLPDSRTSIDAAWTNASSAIGLEVKMIARGKIDHAVEG